ncbi:hypothetical protein [Kribbella sp. NPDC006257]
MRYHALPRLESHPYSVQFHVDLVGPKDTIPEIRPTSCQASS